MPGPWDLKRTAFSQRSEFSEPPGWLAQGRSLQPHFPQGSYLRSGASSRPTWARAFRHGARSGAWEGEAATVFSEDRAITPELGTMALRWTGRIGGCCRTRFLLLTIPQPPNKTCQLSYFRKPHRNGSGPDAEEARGDISMCTPRRGV